MAKIPLWCLSFTLLACAAGDGVSPGTDRSVGQGDAGAEPGAPDSGAPDAVDAGSPMADAGSVAPDAGPTAPPEGACDGRDDDGDGAVDEGCACVPDSTQDCHPDPVHGGVGTCTLGTQTCSGEEFGRWGACTGYASPGTEACDGTLDEDCDGAIDEGCGCVDGATRSCGTDVGRCMTGSQTCTAGAWGECVGGVGPSGELCDGANDEDCDGAVDEGCPVCREVDYSWDYPDGCTLTTRYETAQAPADFWPGRPLLARLMTSYFDDCGRVGNLQLPVSECAQGLDSNIPTPTDIGTLTADGRGVPIEIRNLACFAYQARVRIRWCAMYVP